MDRLPSGLYRARFQFHGTKHTFTGSTIENVEGIARKARYELERGLWIDPKDENEVATAGDRVMLADAIDRYVLEVTATHRGCAIETATWRVIKCEPLAGKILSSITPADVEALRTRWRTQKSPRPKGGTDTDADAEGGYAVATINRRISLLSALYNHAARPIRTPAAEKAALAAAALHPGRRKPKWGWGMKALGNPVRGLDPRVLEGEHQRSRRLSDEEIAEWLAASRSPELSAFMHLALESAMRRSEIAGLKWSEVDFEKKRVDLPPPRTKSGKGREVPLSPGALDLLHRLQQSATPGDNKVFHRNPSTYTLSARRALRRARTRYLEKCAADGRAPNPHWLADARLHDLRHEAATRYAKKFSLLRLKRITGHKTNRMVERYYNESTTDIAEEM